MIVCRSLYVPLVRRTFSFFSRYVFVFTTLRSFMARVLNNRRRCILWSPGGDRRSRCHLAINSCNWEIFGPSLQKACKIENKYWVLGSLTWTFPYFERFWQSGHGSKSCRVLSAYFKGFTASDSGSTAKCHVPACILRPVYPRRMKTGVNLEKWLRK